MFKWLSLKPAKVLRIANRGSIEPGKYADLVAWKPEDTFVVKTSYSKYPETCAYNG
jgi:dihydroorotase-like cyclic amidohydrolase